MALAPGLTGEATVKVTQENTAAAVASGALEVFSTPMLLALMEKAAFNVVQPHLGEGETTVGTGVELKHLAATPVGLEVRAVARLDAVDGRKLRFTIEAFDSVEKVGEAVHERFVVSTDRFMGKAQRKMG